MIVYCYIYIDIVGIISYNNVFCGGFVDNNKFNFLKFG